MIHIRPESPEDAAAIANVIRLAFGGDDEVRLVDRLRGAADFDPALSRIAEIDGRIVGHILFTQCVIDGDDGRSTPVVCLAPMAVLPKCQRQGVGSALVRDGLRVCTECGHHIITVLGHPAYYPRFGFLPASRFGIRSPFPAPDDVFMVRATSPDDLIGVAGILRYPSPFNDLTTD